MNFLIKIEEAINRLIEKLLESLKGIIPDFLFEAIKFLTQIPKILVSKIAKLKPKISIFYLKTIGYFLHYTTIIRGHIITFVMYLRSEEFKNADKKSLMTKPFKYAKLNPLKSISTLLSCLILTIVFSVIYQNAHKIAIGTLSLRKPASVSQEEDIYIELKNHKFEVHMGSAGGGHGAATAEAHEHEIFLDVKIETENPKEKEFLEHMEEMLDDNLEALELSVTQLPISTEDQKALSEKMMKTLNLDFKEIGHEHPIKSITLKQIVPGRPVYFRQAERMITIEDINLQIFLEDTHRNRQVWLDFSALTSNRNAALYLKDHVVEIKDYLTTNVEPVLPQLPVEEEGRLIIKEKIRSELNQFLEKNAIEGKILEIYIDYLMAS